MAPFTHRPTTLADIPEQLTMGERAFVNDRMARIAFPPSRRDPARPNEEREYREARYIKRLANPAGRWWTCVDEGAGGRIAGSSGWTRLTKETEAEEAEKKKKEEEEEKLPACADAVVLKRIMEAMEAMKKKWTGEMEAVWYLGHLATDPDYQRQGIGKGLLKWGCDEADKEGIYAYLESTPAGRKLYESMGFEHVDQIELSDVVEGGEPSAYWIMLRKPKGKVEGNAES
ncbi:acyl-CoA N-acyltransferase [Mytilinidion resinicola]|uniref:Acyl-CoA N-acyltransferase n=1 Tax=Mytilinidion resinicola TaxID=574789 RepID=A0A6A6YMX0_9PEZI|nr:acyl-CoA N-acyltransferase [Mytilinidion resinicola]KAF2810222.1 acyl-CoA N-acyltransferase [Mytilinidion resinicola]